MDSYWSIAGGVVGISVLIYYAICVWRGKTPASSIASWLLWTLIDALLLVTTGQAGKPVLLPLGWTFGAGCVTLSLLKCGEWTWSWKETLSAVSAAVATAVWLTTDAATGVFAGTIALTVAGIPILVDMIKKPVPEIAYIFFFSGLACVFTLLGSDGSFTATFMPACSALFNITMVLIVMRKEY